MRTLADYTANDVVPEDRTQYAKHVEQWQTELQPNGMLECCFAAEIVRAAWCIERYAIFDTPDLTPEARAAALRYRTQTNLGIRRNLEELRRLQSDRYLQNHLGLSLPGVASLKLVLPGFRLAKQQSKQRSEQPIVSESQANRDTNPVATSEAVLPAEIQHEERRPLNQFASGSSGESARRPADPAKPSPKPAAPRNALCPCNSGHKYKRCCGHWSKTPMPKAA